MRRATTDHQFEGTSVYINEPLQGRTVLSSDSVFSETARQTGHSVQHAFWLGVLGVLTGCNIVVRLATRRINLRRRRYHVWEVNSKAQHGTAFFEEQTIEQFGS